MNNEQGIMNGEVLTFRISLFDIPCSIFDIKETVK
jgi:hypothetical protein